MENKLKACNVCGAKKPETLEFFGKKKDKLNAKCRPCYAVHMREYNKNNSDRVKATSKARYIPKQRNRMSDEEKRIRSIIAVRKWQEKNKDKVLEYNRTANKKRMADSAYRVIHSVRGSIWKILKGKVKTSGAFRFLDYSYDELRSHLERQFLTGMTWDNYGEWHVDHIRPISSFDIKSAGDEDFNVCWSLSNLRPLWATDNQSKWAKNEYLL